MSDQYEEIYLNIYKRGKNLVDKKNCNECAEINKSEEKKADFTNINISSKEQLYSYCLNNAYSFKNKKDELSNINTRLRGYETILIPISIILVILSVIIYSTSMTTIKIKLDIIDYIVSSYFLISKHDIAKYTLTSLTIIAIILSSAAIELNTKIKTHIKSYINIASLLSILSLLLIESNHTILFISIISIFCLIFVTMLNKIRGYTKMFNRYKNAEKILLLKSVEIRNSNFTSPDFVENKLKEIHLFLEETHKDTNLNTSGDSTNIINIIAKKFSP